MFCKKCGAAINDNEKFCSNCGENLVLLKNLIQDNPDTESEPIPDDTAHENKSNAADMSPAENPLTSAADSQYAANDSAAGLADKQSDSGNVKKKVIILSITAVVLLIAVVLAVILPTAIKNLDNESSTLPDQSISSVSSASPGQIIINETTISAGSDHTVALKSDGTLVAVGVNGSYQCDVRDLTNIVAVSAGCWHTVGLRPDGTVVAVGDNNRGQCDVQDWTDIIAVAAGDFYTVGLKSDGTVVAIGDNEYGQCDVQDWNDIVAISAGDSHTVGLKSDGTVVAVGNNAHGRCNIREWSGIVAVAVGDSYTVGLKTDGSVVAVGNNYYGQCDVQDWTDIVAVSAGYAHTVGLKSDGTVVVVGDNDRGQCDIQDWSDIVAISAGDSHTVGLKSDRTVVAAGWNMYGQCNVQDWTDIMLPGQKVSINSNAESTTSPASTTSSGSSASSGKISINEALLSDLGSTYGEIRAKYGEGTNISGFEFELFASFKNGGYNFRSKDIYGDAYSGDGEGFYNVIPEEDAVCDRIATDAKTLFGDFNGSYSMSDIEQALGVTASRELYRPASEREGNYCHFEYGHCMIDIDLDGIGNEFTKDSDVFLVLKYSFVDGKLVID